MNKNKDLTEQTQTAWGIFCDKFLPATSEADATHFYTTEEIITALKRLTPDAYADPNIIYNFLYTKGYRLTIDTSHTILVYKWMLKVIANKEKFINLAEK